MCTGVCWCAELDGAGTSSIVLTSHRFHIKCESIPQLEQEDFFLFLVRKLKTD